MPADGPTKSASIAAANVAPNRNEEAHAATGLSHRKAHSRANVSRPLHVRADDAVRDLRRWLRLQAVQCALVRPFSKANHGPLGCLAWTAFAFFRAALHVRSIACAHLFSRAYCFAHV